MINITQGLKMKKIAKIMGDSTTKGKCPPSRDTVRALIIKDNKIHLTFSRRYQDYLTPGGGVEEGESLIEALKRELKEELGALIKKYQAFGYLETINNCNNQERISKHYYYLVEVEKYLTPNKEKYELDFGMESKWVTPIEAIKQNELIIAKRLKEGSDLLEPTLILKREIVILKYLKEYLDEKILFN